MRIEPLVPVNLTLLAILVAPFGHSTSISFGLREAQLALGSSEGSLSLIQ